MKTQLLSLVVTALCAAQLAPAAEIASGTVPKPVPPDFRTYQYDPGAFDQAYGELSEAAKKRLSPSFLENARWMSLEGAREFVVRVAAPSVVDELRDLGFEILDGDDSLTASGGTILVSATLRQVLHAAELSGLKAIAFHTFVFETN
jgi:hypothetical protein